MLRGKSAAHGLAPVLMALLALATGLTFAGEESTEPRSLRNANYTIEVELDAEAGTLTGTQRLEWRNVQDEPTAELWFHLYWNAWRNSRSSWMLEDRLRSRSSLGDDVREEDWGWIEVDEIRLVGAEGSDPVDLTPTMHHVSPDDDNPDDRTVLVVALPRPVESGETISVDMTWRARIPRTFARTGRRGDYHFIAHWFPKVGVYEKEGWNCHQFHAATEFYADFGVYDVTIRAPSRLVVGATGREASRDDDGSGTTTHRYRQEDVHAFTWAASPDFLVHEARFEEPGLPGVDLRLLYHGEHHGQVERHLDATRAALESYGRWYGPYPYGHLTIVDPAWQSGTGGMEYPTLFTSGTRLLNPVGGDSPEGVTIHESGHQFWYGVVGNNEFEHAWLDEGLNTFSTIRTLEAHYPPRKFVRRYLHPPFLPGSGRGFLPVVFHDIEVSRWSRRLNRYRKFGTRDAPERPTFSYYPEASSTLSYDKTALWLATLERYLGWPTLQEVLATYFHRFRYRHPRPEDFFAVANEVSGQDLTWFFDQVYRGSDLFDYAIRSVASEPAALQGWTESGPELRYMGTPQASDGVAASVDDAASGSEIFRTEVVVQRLGGGRFPVEVLMVFEDGHRIVESWDGESRWEHLVVERESRLLYAEVDPDRILALDPNRSNNSRVLDSRPELPAWKWASKWMIWLQDRLATFAFFI